MIEVTPDVIHLIDLALAEDQVANDATTNALVGDQVSGVGTVYSKEEGILAGLHVAMAVFHRIDSSVRTKELLKDGDSLEIGSAIAVVEGKASTILKGERIALNILQRMSGIATQTSLYVKAIYGSSAKIADTRKTVPGFRLLDKYAVKAGGGHNHRMNLGDGILIKDNHIQILRDKGISLSDIVVQAMHNAPHTLKIEVEVNNLVDLQEVLSTGADIILLDNMSSNDIRAAVQLVQGRVLLEASGGITLDNVGEIAETGVDLISVGALTHSVTALDINLDFVS